MHKRFTTNSQKMHGKIPKLCLLLRKIDRLHTVEQLFSTATKMQLNFYKLSLQGPPTIYNSGPQEFTIHGLWPQNSNDDVVIPLI